MDDAKRKSVLGWMQRIEGSALSIAVFFKEHEVPFSKAQYFIYKKQLALSGPEGIQDRRSRGGNRKLSEEAEGFLLGCVKTKPDVTLEWLQGEIKKNFSLEVDQSAISRAIKRVSSNQAHLLRGRRKSTPKPEVVINPVGGFEIIVAIAYHLGWGQRVAEVITNEITELKQRKAFKRNAGRSDKQGRTKFGKFSARYNKRKEVRDSRFAAISEKRKSKNWQSMDIVRDDPSVLIRKSLAVLSLPIITMNGNVRSADLALGDSLRHLCGFNYKQTTIVKYLSELKYLGISIQLLQEMADFWRQLWSEDLADSMAGALLCYYIDGNTKAVWSSQRVKQNKVTMLGWVMG